MVAPGFQAYNLKIDFERERKIVAPSNTITFVAGRLFLK